MEQVIIHVQLMDLLQTQVSGLGPLSFTTSSDMSALMVALTAATGTMAAAAVSVQS